MLAGDLSILEALEQPDPTDAIRELLLQALDREHLIASDPDHQHSDSTGPSKPAPAATAQQNIVSFSHAVCLLSLALSCSLSRALCVSVSVSVSVCLCLLCAVFVTFLTPNWVDFAGEAAEAARGY